jgi:hypothetical protein
MICNSMERLVVLTFVVFVISATINVQLNPGQSTCFKIVGGQDYRVEYVISGVDENKTEFKLLRDDQVILNITNRSQYSEVVKVPEGLIDLCFESGDSNHK